MWLSCWHETPLVALALARKMQKNSSDNRSSRTSVLMMYWISVYPRLTSLLLYVISSFSFFKVSTWHSNAHHQNGSADTSNFDEEFTREQPTLTPVHGQLSSRDQAEFNGFSWVGYLFIFSLWKWEAYHHVTRWRLGQIYNSTNRLFLLCNYINHRFEPCTLGYFVFFLTLWECESRAEWFWPKLHSCCCCCCCRLVSSVQDDLLYQAGQAVAP